MPGFCLKRIMKNSYLNIKQPRFDLIDSLFAIRHLPHGDVQGAMRQETLMCGIVLPLKHAYIEDITRRREGMNFIFEW